MRHSISTDHAQEPTSSLRHHSRPPSSEPPEPGDRFLGPSGKIWTVQALTARGNRIELTTPTAEGDAGAIVDAVAIARMIPLPVASSSPDNAPQLRATGARTGLIATPRTRPHTRAIPHTAAGVADDAGRQPRSRPVSHEQHADSGGRRASVDTTTSSSVDVASMESAAVDLHVVAARRSSASTSGEP